MTELCEARDADAELTCVLEEGHVGGHYDREYGEWANGTNWCPDYQERNGRKYFCVYKRNHFGVHQNPVVGPWPQEERPLPKLKAGEDIAAGDRVEIYMGDDFPCCSNGEHGKRYAPMTREDLIFPKAVVEFSARVALKRARMARRPVTKS